MIIVVIVVELECMIVVIVDVLVMMWMTITLMEGFLSILSRKEVVVTAATTCCIWYGLIAAYIGTIMQIICIYGHRI